MLIPNSGYKELERQLKEKQVPYSATKVIEITQSIFEIEIKTPKSQEIVRKVLFVNQEQKNKRVSSIWV